MKKDTIWNLEWKIIIVTVLITLAAGIFLFLRLNRNLSEDTTVRYQGAVFAVYEGGTDYGTVADLFICI